MNAEEEYWKTRAMKLRAQYMDDISPWIKRLTDIYMHSATVKQLVDGEPEPRLSYRHSESEKEAIMVCRARIDAIRAEYHEKYPHLF